MFGIIKSQTQTEITFSCPICEKDLSGFLDPIEKDEENPGDILFLDITCVECGNHMNVSLPENGEVFAIVSFSSTVKEMMSTKGEAALWDLWNMKQKEKTDSNETEV